jgi:hypothetical protein
VLAALSLLTLVASACQYAPIASLWGGQGHVLGMHTAPWRDLRDDLQNLPEGAPLLVSNNPATDPALYYLASYEPRRIKLAGEPPDAELPPQFWLIHVEDNWFCQNFLEALKARGATLTPLARHGVLVLYEVHTQVSGTP